MRPSASIFCRNGKAMASRPGRAGPGSTYLPKRRCSTFILRLHPAPAQVRQADKHAGTAKGICIYERQTGKGACRGQRPAAAWLVRNQTIPYDWRWGHRLREGGPNFLAHYLYPVGSLGVCGRPTGPQRAHRFLPLRRTGAGRKAAPPREAPLPYRAHSAGRVPASSPTIASCRVSRSPGSQAKIRRYHPCACVYVPERRGGWACCGHGTDGRVTRRRPCVSTYSSRLVLSWAHLLSAYYIIDAAAAHGGRLHRNFSGPGRDWRAHEGAHR